MGVPKDHIILLKTGDVLDIDEDHAKVVDHVSCNEVFVDGLGVGDVGSIVLRDRKHLGQDGLIIIVASLDVYDGHVISGPDVVSRGFVYVRESEQLLEEVRKLALDILEDCADNNIHEWGIIKNRIKDEISKLIAQRTRRAPMILPILQEV
jgi:ribonuclease J